MSFRVPPDHVRYLQEFLKLPEESTDGLLSALEKAEPSFNFAELAAQIFSPDLMPWSLTDGIVRVLVSLYRTGDRREEAIENFLDTEVRPSFAEAEVFSQENGKEEWAKLRRFFLAALTCERSLGTAAKAGPVMTDHEHVFCGARILTDLRPIYHFATSEKPTAATVIHMLKITHRDQYKHRYDAFFALDGNDLKTLQHLIERAAKKEETLRDVMKESGVTVLNPGTIY